MSVAGAILAGGRASRMGGRAKSFLTVGGARIIDRQLRVVRPLFNELLISANDPAPFAEFGLPVVADAVKDVGPLGGVLAVLDAISADSVVVVACDLPFISQAAIELLLANWRDADVVCPTVNGRPEPLFARYSRRCAAAIRARLHAGERRVSSFFADVSVAWIDEPALRAVDAQLGFLANCNTPEDLV